MKRIRVLVVDDHAVVRQGLRTFLESEEDIEVVGEAGNGEEAVRKAQDLAPDVVLMDLVMPGMGGSVATQKIIEVSPHSSVLALTSFSEDDKVFPAIKAGAKGYLLKDAPAEALGRAIRSLARGEFLLDGEIANKVLEEFHSVSQPIHPPVEDLTPREVEVLALIARGHANKEIAQSLGISIKTVKTHVGNILGKLHVMDRTQAAIHAVRQGLVPQSDGDEGED